MPSRGSSPTSLRPATRQLRTSGALVSADATAATARRRSGHSRRTNRRLMTLHSVRREPATSPPSGVAERSRATRLVSRIARAFSVGHAEPWHCRMRPRCATPSTRLRSRASRRPSSPDTPDRRAHPYPTRPHVLRRRLQDLRCPTSRGVDDTPKGGPHGGRAAVACAATRQRTTPRQPQPRPRTPQRRLCAHASAGDGTTPHAIGIGERVAKPHRSRQGPTAARSAAHALPLMAAIDVPAPAAAHVTWAVPPEASGGARKRAAGGVWLDDQAGLRRRATVGRRRRSRDSRRREGPASAPAPACHRSAPSAYPRGRAHPCGRPERHPCSLEPHAVRGATASDLRYRLKSSSDPQSRRIRRIRARRSGNWGSFCGMRRAAASSSSRS